MPQRWRPTTCFVWDAGETKTTCQDQSSKYIWQLFMMDASHFYTGNIWKHFHSLHFCIVYTFTYIYIHLKIQSWHGRVCHFVVWSCLRMFMKGYERFVCLFWLNPVVLRVQEHMRQTFWSKLGQQHRLGWDLVLQELAAFCSLGSGDWAPDALPQKSSGSTCSPHGLVSQARI